MYDRGIGKWILPQPEDTKEYIKIPKFGRLAPFGYKEDEEEGWLAPIPSELDALEEAKKHLKQYSLREVAAWLSRKTGRSITATGLKERIKYEQSNKRKASAYRRLALLYEEALRKAKLYEEKVGAYKERSSTSTTSTASGRASTTTVGSGGSTGRGSSCHI